MEKEKKAKINMFGNDALCLNIIYVYFSQDIS